jgi:hypothetical protein
MLSNQFVVNKLWFCTNNLTNTHLFKFSIASNAFKRNSEAKNLELQRQESLQVELRLRIHREKQGGRDAHATL